MNNENPEDNDADDPVPPVPPDLATLLATMQTFQQQQQVQQQQIATLLQTLANAPPPQLPQPLQPQLQQPLPQGGVATLLLDFHHTGLPYDLSTRAGLSAYKEACEAIALKFDGAAKDYPLFINAFVHKARKCHWDATNPTGITKYGPQDLFQDIAQITTATLNAAFISRSDPRAKQNSKALFNALSDSISGNLRITLFEQGHQSFPSHQDGPLLLKSILDHTTIDTAPAANEAMQQMYLLDPATFNYNIVDINLELGRLFIRISQNPSFNQQNDGWRILNALQIYRKIQQPAEWARFVHDKDGDYHRGQITSLHHLYRDAERVYRECKGFTNEYIPSNITARDEIAAMYSDFKHGKPRQTPKAKAKDDKKDDGKSNDKTLPPFVLHDRTPANRGNKPYKADDTKVWNDKTYYFHVAPNHRDKKRWFLHTCATCKQCNRWKTQENDGTPDSAASSDTGTSANLSDLTSATDPVDRAEAYMTEAFDLLEGQHGNSASIQEKLAAAFPLFT